MANVLFKRGTQANLATAQHIDGCFYLTTDTHRLYVGEGGAIVPVNQGVITVEEVNKLPAGSAIEIGHFYYATKENVLCVYNGNRWVQINPDTNTKVSGVTITTSVSNGVATVVTEVASDDGGKKSSSFTVTGSNGVDVKKTGDNLVIDGEKYTISSEADLADTDLIHVKLTSDKHVDVTNPRNSEFTIKAGDNIQISKDASGNIVITGSEGFTIASFTAGAGSGKAGDTSDAANKGFHVSIKETGGKEHLAQFRPSIKVNGVSVEFEDGTAELDVYSKGQIDGLMRELNAMVYRGTCGTGGTVTAAPTKEVKIGDTYRCVSDVTVNGATAKTGDLIIARGDEDSTTGYITGTVIWDIIPSGNDVDNDTKYIGKAVDNGMELQEVGGGSVLKLQIAGDGEYIVVEDSATTDSAKSNTVTLSHKTVTQSDSSVNATEMAAEPATAYEITAVTGVTRDAAGHVTGLVTTKYKVKDTNGSLQSVAKTVAVSNNIATVTTTASFKHAGGGTDTKSAAQTFTSDSLTFAEAGDGAGLSINMEWASF